MGRTVTLVLVDTAGAVLGALPPFDVELPWWQEVGDVVAAARARYGVDVQVLRLLSAYADFLDRIEPSQRPYHEADVPERLALAVAVAAAGRTVET